jgi:hypothetical protein
MIAPLSESLKRPAHGDTGVHYVFLMQVLYIPGIYSPKGTNKCTHFEEIKNLRDPYGYESRGSLRSCVAGFDKKSKISSSRRPASEEGDVKQKQNRKIDEKRCLADGTMTRLW